MPSQVSWIARAFALGIVTMTESSLGMQACVSYFGGGGHARGTYKPGNE